MTDFVCSQWERAERTLASARLLVAEDPDSAVSRAYYAAFHAATAAFAIRGRLFNKHSAIRAALHRDMVLPGLVDARTGLDYDSLMESRDAADYGGIERVSTEDAALAVGKAEAFIATMRRISAHGT